MKWLAVRMSHVLMACARRTNNLTLWLGKVARQIERYGLS